MDSSACGKQKNLEEKKKASRNRSPKNYNETHRNLRGKYTYYTVSNEGRAGESAS